MTIEWTPDTIVEAVIWVDVDIEQLELRINPESTAGFLE